MKNELKNKSKDTVKKKISKSDHSKNQNSNNLGTPERAISALEYNEQRAELEQAQESLKVNTAAYMQLASSAVTQPKWDLDNITTLCRDIALQIRELEIEPLKIKKISGIKFRVDGLSLRYKDSVENLVEQVKMNNHADESVIFNAPLIYKNETNDLYCISGWKRIKAVEKAGLQEIHCRVLPYKIVLNALNKNNILTEHDEALKIAFNHIVYSEAEHTSPLDDMSILNYFNQLRQCNSFKREQFNEVLKFIGINRKNSRYNDLYRLWNIACSPIAYKLVANKKVRMRLFKNHNNIGIMHVESKALKIQQKIDDYIQLCKEKHDSEKPDPEIFDLDTYEDNDIQKIIFEVDQPGLSTDELDARKYRSPKNSINIRGSAISITNLTINFDDKSDNNARNIIETLYILESVTKDLQGYAAAIKNQVVDDFAKPTLPSLKGTEIKYDEKYYNFIRDNNLWDFCNVISLSRYLQEKGDFNYSKSDFKNLEKLPTAKRAKILIQKFREYAAIKSGEDIKREHAEANATDEEIKFNGAIPLAPLEDDAMWDAKPKTIIKPAAKTKLKTNKKRRK